MIATSEMASSAAIEFEPTPANISVWLVDDNDCFRSTLGELLGRFSGLRCERQFASPDAMLSTLASHVGPDVILLDVQMRDRNGLDAIGAIKALSRDTQVLMLTSMYDTEGYNRAIAEGASDFLLKSYTPDEIVQRIRNPSRRINARRRPQVRVSCATRELRTVPPRAKAAPSPFVGRLRFLRTLLG